MEIGFGLQFSVYKLRRTWRDLNSASFDISRETHSVHSEVTRKSVTVIRYCHSCSPYLGCPWPRYKYCRMTRKLFGLYRSYRLGVGDVLGMVMLGLLVLAAIAIAISTTTTNVHPGMLGLGVVVIVIIMFTLICGWQSGLRYKVPAKETQLDCDDGNQKCVVGYKAVVTFYSSKRKY